MDDQMVEGIICQYDLQCGVSMYNLSSYLENLEDLDLLKSNFMQSRCIKGHPSVSSSLMNPTCVFSFIFKNIDFCYFLADF